jgi:hypothetical protein
MGTGKRGQNKTAIKSHQRGVTTEQAISILKKEGVEVNEKDAEIILDFLYILAKLAVNQYVNEE